MANNPEYVSIADAIEKGLKNVEKYYQKTSDSDVYFICLGEYQFFASNSFLTSLQYLTPTTSWHMSKADGVIQRLRVEKLVFRLW
jgi:hypothetical protein